MTYETVSQFSAFWGLIFFFVFFLGVLVYTFWPKSKQRFEDAAKIPFKDES